MTQLGMNRLAQETSPYLQQHANNPVDWYPWGEEALKKARDENKPILLSIGYSACHWCHVMAHESFEDEQTAKLMNELFVNIKIDREERPDLDKIYQTAHYYLNQRGGGWPLTLFLTPDDHVAFFSGTYFPLEARHQLPAFKDVLRMIADVYKHQHNEIKQQNEQLVKVLQYQLVLDVSTKLNPQPIQAAVQALGKSFDTVNGGFGHAPKFPQPTWLEFLMYTIPTSKGGKADFYVLSTLQHMAEGGINDQLAGGFYRYSVDSKWQIPHFEKMLYDNAQLLWLYASTAKQKKSAFFSGITRETADWVIQVMQSPEGGYYSSLDADSEGHEGKYYVWDKEVIASILTEEEYELIALYYGLDNPPNFEGEWHLIVSLSIELVAEHLKITFLKANKILQSAKQKLLAVRNARVPPACDNKILTAWNGLMIKGMLVAGDLLQEKKYIESANRAMAFIYQNLYVNKRLLVSYKDGKAHLPAYLDDYVFLLDALITSLRNSWETDKLMFALQLANSMIELFYDEKNGGFYFTANDHEKLLYRPKMMSDDVIPSGNAIAVRVLLLLGHLLGEQRYLQVAERTLQIAWPTLAKLPAHHCSMLLALGEYLKPSTIIVIRGTEDEMKQWRDTCNSFENIVFSIPVDEQQLPEALAAKKSTGKTCAYVCQGLQCLEVIDSLEALKLSS